MEKELQGKLVEILSSIQAATGTAADFAMDQLPDIAQSYVIYGRIWLALAALICSLIAVIAFKATAKWFEPSDGMSVFISVLVGVPASITAICFLRDLILVWAAPKVWLLKELAELVK